MSLDDPGKFVFLTACRNEERILREFLAEFAHVLEQASLKQSAILYVVDDLSLDGSIAAIEDGARERGLDARVIRAPSNLGNQGAMFYGLQRITLGPLDVLVTFDCDGEDDVRSIPEIIALGRENPGKLVLVERGRRHESLKFKVCFGAYKALFRYLTGKTVIPNNFMLIPAERVAAIRRSPLAAVHLAYGVLKLGFPHVAVTRDRRPRYGGNSSQNLFMLVSHGMVGLMVFYEVVVGKLFFLIFFLIALALGEAVAKAALPAGHETLERILAGALVATGSSMIGLLALLLSASLALIFKVSVFTLLQADEVFSVGGPRGAPTPRAAAHGERPSAAPAETSGRAGS